MEKEGRLFVTNIYRNSIGVMRGRTRRENPLYPVSFWNVKKRVDEDLPRTNNAVEGFHSALRSSNACKHPNVWKLIAALKKRRITTNQKNPCENFTGTEFTASSPMLSVKAQSIVVNF